MERSGTVLGGMENKGFARAIVAEGTASSGIKIWASVGAAWLTLFSYLIISWVGSDYIGRTPTGVDPVPGWMQTLATTLDIVSPIFWLICVYIFIVRPWRRDGALSTDGMFLIAWLTMYVQDPWLNGTQYWLAFNSAHFNLGCWVTELPGWNSPNLNLLPEPLLCWGFGYSWMGFLPTLGGLWAMRKMKATRPQTGVVGLFLIAFTAMAVLDFVIEGFFVRTHLYAYLGAIPWLSLWAGEIHQFPVYEIFFWSLNWTVIIQFMYYKNDKGEMWMHRGSQKLGVSNKFKKALQLVAIIGLCNTVELFTYNIPLQFFAMHAAPFPKDTPTYLLNGICGKGTKYSCPGPDVPIPRMTSSAVPPEKGYCPNIGGCD